MDTTTKAPTPMPSPHEDLPPGAAPSHVYAHLQKPSCYETVAHCALPFCAVACSPCPWLAVCSKPISRKTNHKCDPCIISSIKWWLGCQNTLASHRWQYYTTDQHGMSCAKNGPLTCIVSAVVFGCGQLDALSIIEPEQDRKKWFGDTFFIGGKLAVADTDEVNRRLLSPMDRGNNIGKPNVTPSFMSPPFGDERIFPLSLPSGKCPMNNGAHRGFRAQYAKYIGTKASLKRAAATDPVVATALDAVRAASVQTKGEYLAPLKEAVRDYILRTLFWALFRIDLGEADSREFKAAEAGYSTISGVITHYNVGDLVADGLIRRLPESLTKSADLAYLREMILNAPTLASYQEDDSLETCPDKARFAAQLVPVIIVAAMQGVSTLANHLLKGAAEPTASSNFEPAWRAGLPRDFPLPIGDFDKMRLVVLETARLNPPVPETVSVLHEEQTIEVDGAPKRFPPGCPVLLSYANTAVDDAVYHHPRRFAPYEHKAALWGPKAKFNGFNSVGDKGARICPGRDISLTILVNMLEAVRSPEQRPKPSRKSFGL